MKLNITLLSFLFIIVSACNKEKNVASIKEIVNSLPFIEGNEAYLNSPMVTAGNRVYMVGHQNGSFPELGWHIKDEMGGIWNHPIKLMDGFDLELVLDDSTFSLNNASKFVNYPLSNSHQYYWESKALSIERWQFVPDDVEGVYIELLIENPSNEKQIEINFTGYVDLSPTWLGERTQMIDGKDTAQWNDNILAYIAKDSINPWYTIFGTNIVPTAKKISENNYKGKGVAQTLTYNISLKKGTNKIPFYIAGSYRSKENAVATFSNLKDNSTQLLIDKINRLNKIANKTKLTTPDASLNQAFEWVKYNNDWLVRTVPEIGSGIGAGIPDYPWWFGVDSEYALQGYMALGQWDAVYNSIKLLDSVSIKTNGNGKIIHEMSTNGAVFNPGNINETPQFASLIWFVYQWSGDKAFLEKYFTTIQKGLQWLLEENDENKNLFPDGFGMMEIHGMNSEMIDVAAYTYKAFEDASKIANVLQKYELAEEYKDIALAIKQKINTQFWSETFQSYADFIGTDQQALQLIEDAIIRADTLNKPWAVNELQQTKQEILNNPSKSTRPFVLHHNWVVNTPMEVKIAPPDKAKKALKTAERFVNPFGVFVTGIDRDESAGSDEGSFKGSKIFSYTGAVMTLPTGVQIVAENNYGNPNQALNYLKRLTRSFSYALPGSTYEVSPDYGMMVQAWNCYGYAIPVVTQFFGIKPDAGNKTIYINPQMPDEWQKASLENIIIGDNEISVFTFQENGKQVWKITQSKNWKIIFSVPDKSLKTTEVVVGKTLNSKNPYTFTSNEFVIKY